MDLLLAALLQVAQSNPQETLSTGNEQTILAYIVVVLAGAVVAEALYIMRLISTHKSESESQSKGHTQNLVTQNDKHAAAVKKLNDELHNERNDRRQQETRYLKEVIETCQAMSRSLDENTKMGQRLETMGERLEETISRALETMRGRIESTIERAFREQGG